MSQVNLLPPEIRQRQAVRRNTALVALAGLVVIVLLGFFYFLQTLNLSQVNKDVEAQQSINDQKQAQITSLQKFAELQAQAQGTRSLLNTVFANEVSWSGVLLDLSRVIPEPAVLSSVSGQITVPTGTAPPAAATTGVPSGLVGSISVEGTALDSRTVALWLTRLEQVKGWVNPWATTLTETAVASNVYDFSSGVDLSTAAETKRAQGGAT